MKKFSLEIALVALTLVIFSVVYYFGWRHSSLASYSAEHKDGEVLANATSASKLVVHQPTPNSVRAIYMTAYVVGVREWRTRMLDFIDKTELNAIIIDIKDYTGVLLSERAPDFEDFLRELHERHVYVIGRVSVFQDQAYVKAHPDQAVRRQDNGEVWRDRKGIAWIDPGSKEAWKYVVDIAKDYHALGFDEINFDYIRFPSDGDMQNVSYPHSDETLANADQMKLFYKYLDESLRSEDITISADLFGMTTTSKNDLGIGQILENALAHFDYVAPMVYPSHYPANFNGWANPNKVPGEVIQYVMGSAVNRAIAAGVSPLKLRPWLQDFDYGGEYGEAEVRAQKNAVYDVGLNSWMMWDPSVLYTVSAYDSAK